MKWIFFERRAKDALQIVGLSPYLSGTWYNYIEEKT